jgi:hypothetical protein
MNIAAIMRASNFASRVIRYIEHAHFVSSNYNTPMCFVIINSTSGNTDFRDQAPVSWCQASTKSCDRILHTWQCSPLTSTKTKRRLVSIPTCANAIAPTVPHGVAGKRKKPLLPLEVLILLLLVDLQV